MAGRHLEADQPLRDVPVSPDEQPEKGIRASGGIESAVGSIRRVTDEDAREQAEVMKAKRDLERKERASVALADEFRQRFGVSFRADPPDSLRFEYTSGGEVVVGLAPRVSEFVAGSGGSSLTLPWQVVKLQEYPAAGGAKAWIPYAPFRSDPGNVASMLGTPVTISGLGEFTLPTTNGHVVWIRGNFTTGAFTTAQIESGANTEAMAEWEASTPYRQTKFRFPLGYVGDVPTDPAAGFSFKIGSSTTKFFYQLHVGGLALRTVCMDYPATFPVGWPA